MIRALTPPQPCNRPGCRFERMRTRQRDGKYRRRQQCSPECRTWMRRAERALNGNDGAEAAELLRLSAVLDARRWPTERVAEIFEFDGPRD
ncbi:MULTISPECIES: hypothetical protein [unclassified Streptomyces]|uniref:hypothetical protein n=1 Tax=unclassified Streptomyces TaxID=2593676 RepID=UPI0036FFD705